MSYPQTYPQAKLSTGYPQAQSYPQVNQSYPQVYPQV